MENIDEQLNKKPIAENVFDDSLGGEEFEIIRVLMPEHDEMQRLVAQALRKECEKNKTSSRINVVEIGTGTGFTAARIIEVDPRIFVKSVDKAQKMVAKAKVNLKDRIDNGRLEICEQGALEFLDRFEANSVDSIVSAFTIHNIEKTEREEILKKIFNILKPGGKFINSDKYVPDDPEEYKKIYDWQLDQFKKADVEPKAKEEWISHYIVDDKPEIIMKANESIELMEKIGFANVTLTDRHNLNALLIAEKPGLE